MARRVVARMPAPPTRGAEAARAASTARSTIAASATGASANARHRTAGAASAGPGVGPRRRRDEMPPGESTGIGIEGQGSWGRGLGRQKTCSNPSPPPHFAPQSGRRSGSFRCTSGRQAISAGNCAGGPDFGTTCPPGWERGQRHAGPVMSPPRFADLVSFPRCPDPERRQIASMCARSRRRHGVEVDPSRPGTAISTSSPPSAQHCDGRIVCPATWTSSPSRGQSWATDPFRLRPKDGDRLTGRGTQRHEGLPRLHARRWSPNSGDAADAPDPPRFLDRRGRSAAAVCRICWRGCPICAPLAAGASASRPTCAPVLSHKGKQAIDGDRGRAGHSSTPALGRERALPGGRAPARHSRPRRRLATDGPFDRASTRPIPPCRPG